MSTYHDHVSISFTTLHNIARSTGAQYTTWACLFYMRYLRLWPQHVNSHVSPCSRVYVWRRNSECIAMFFMSLSLTHRRRRDRHCVQHTLTHGLPWSKGTRSKRADETNVHEKRSETQKWFLLAELEGYGGRRSRDLDRKEQNRI